MFDPPEPLPAIPTRTRAPRSWCLPWSGWTAAMPRSWPWCCLDGSWDKSLDKSLTKAGKYFMNLALIHEFHLLVPPWTLQCRCRRVCLRCLDNFRFSVMKHSPFLMDAWLEILEDWSAQNTFIARPIIGSTKKSKCLDSFEPCFKISQGFESYNKNTIKSNLSMLPKKAYNHAQHFIVFVICSKQNSTK